MRIGDYARFLALAAIWGTAFGFIRVVAPVLGAVWTAEGRLLFGALALLVFFRLRGLSMPWRHARFYAVMGFVGAALPFTLLAYAGVHLPASVMAVLGATTPMMVLLLAAALGMERLSMVRVLGTLLGFAGVWLLSDPKATGVDASEGTFALAIAASLATAFAYAAMALVVKHFGAGIPSHGLAFGTQAFGALYLVPVTMLTSPPGSATALVWVNLVVLGVLAGGVAYALYFRLINDIGPTRAQSTAFAAPLFGMLFGIVFLGESMSGGAILGALCILGGVVLVTVGGKPYASRRHD